MQACLCLLNLLLMFIHRCSGHHGRDVPTALVNHDSAQGEQVPDAVSELPRVRAIFPHGASVSLPVTGRPPSAWACFPFWFQTLKACDVSDSRVAA